MHWGDSGSTPELGRSLGEGNGNPFLLLPVKSHGQSLVGYSPQGLKEPHTTEWLNINDGINIYIKLK